MKRSDSVCAPKKDAAITRRYKKIGIAAVAAAAKYQGQKETDFIASSKGKKGKLTGGTSPRRG